MGSDSTDRETLRRIVTSGRAADVALELAQTLDREAAITLALKLLKFETSMPLESWCAAKLVGSEPPNDGAPATAVLTLASTGPLPSFPAAWAVHSKAVTIRQPDLAERMRQFQDQPGRPIYRGPRETTHRLDIDRDGYPSGLCGAMESVAGQGSPPFHFMTGTPGKVTCAACMERSDPPANVYVAIDGSVRPFDAPEPT